MLALILLLLLLLPQITLAGDLHGFRATLSRIHQLSLGKHAEAVRRDSHRIAFLSAAAAAAGEAATNSSVSFKAQLESRAGGYNMNVSIGTPPVTFPVLADTGSNLIWAQCAPCTKCFPQPARPLQPGSSSTFSKLPCSSSFCEFLPNSSRACNATGCVYYYPYGSGYTAGYLATETLEVGESSFSDVAFGCSTENGMDNSSGIAGLGRGPLSLVSQLGVGRFSYCLRSDGDAGGGDSPILFGSLAKLADANVQSTPFVKNPESRPTFYYVNLTGITVGATDLPVTASTFGFTQSGGGTVVDSGSTYTYLAKDGYAMVKQAFLSQMANLTAVNGTRFGLNLGVNIDAGAGGDVLVPRLVLRFAGGAEYDVPSKGYFAPVEVDSQGRVTVACLTVLPTTDNLPVSIIGNLMQMDLHLLYDLDGGMLSFAPANCSEV
uniref:Peptidase A1 domain-containing protein n=1 Tax=Oryza brachyantha TaxID=4533 RepID=J3MLK3_ORYBR